MTTWRRWKSFVSDSGNLRTGWMLAAGVVALYIGAIHPREYVGGINNSKATGLAAQTEEIGLWHQMRLLPNWEEPLYQAGIATVAQPQVMTYTSRGSLADVDKDRKVVQTSSWELIVKKPAETAGSIRRLAESMGGFLVSSQISGGQDTPFCSLTIRIPVSRFEDARIQIEKLALRVEGENVELQDMTRQYVDQSANLRNLKAEEIQYLSILKQSRTVKDTLDVSEKLGEIRGKIDQQQAEFEALSKQIDTVSIVVSLRAEAEARVFGLNWRPLYQIKMALREGIDALGRYVLAMTGFVFLLPAVLLWVVTIIIGLAFGWKLLRFLGRRAFGIKGSAAATHA